MWGGAFTSVPNDLAWSFGQSFRNDLALFDQEIAISIAHAKMLGMCRVIPAAESRRIVSALKAIKPSDLDPASEDIHAAVESALREKVGDAAGKLHTARSRNDQIATATRLWTRAASKRTQARIKKLQSVILALAAKHSDVPMPGYTHQQRAQPITLGYHLLAHFWPLQRDGVRFEQLSEACDSCPLGSGALSGTPFPIDRKLTASELGFSRISPSALDAVSDRDFVGDALHAIATAMQHLARISQELILWSGAEFGFVKLSDAFSTGSSIMPQKRNPDSCELIRGRVGKTVGAWVAFQTMMKALPFAYNRDQQEDKAALFECFKLLDDALELTANILRTAKFHTSKMRAEAGKGFSTATTLADQLAAGGMPFRQAHEIVGKLVLYCEQYGIEISEVPAEHLRKIHSCLDANMLKSTDVMASIASRDSEGGVGPKAFRTQIAKAKALHTKQGFLQNG